MSKESYIADLKEKVKFLDGLLDGKDLQIRIIENDLVEVTQSSISVTNSTIIIIEIMMELNLFIQKNGLTEAAKKSKIRLNKLLELNREQDKISQKSYELKLINRELHKNYQLLRIENKELKKQLQQVTDAQNF